LNVYIDTTTKDLATASGAERVTNGADKHCTLGCMSWQLLRRTKISLLECAAVGTAR